jgi:hypothetical protein
MAGLRNLLDRTPSGRLALGTPFIGRLGSEILAASSAGVHGPGPMANDGLDPLKRYRLIVVSRTFPAGSLEINELGQLTATASGTAIYELAENNLFDPAPDADRTITAFIGTLATIPVITTQPQSVAATAGTSASFSVTATGASNYQWRRNGTNIAGATAATYSLTAALADNGALFSVVVTNSAGSVTSSAATLTVTAAVVAPAFTTQPQPRTVTEGQAASFSAVATGTEPISYQWLRDGVPIPGATGLSYTLPAAALADNGSLFALRATNIAGTVQSAGATLTVTATPVVPAPVPTRTIAYTTMARTIAMDLPDCPLPMIVLALREAVEQFYTDTRAWRITDATVATTVARQAFYSVSGLPTGAVLVGLPGLFIGDQKLAEHREDNLSEPGSVSKTVQARVVGGSMIELVPMPENGGDLIRGNIAIAPSPLASTMLEELWVKHSKALRAYARGLLMDQQGKPWSNPNMALKHMAEYRTLAQRYSAMSGPISREPRLRVRPSPV